MSQLTKANLSELVLLRQATIDDMSSVRYVHASAFRILAAEDHTEEEIEAYLGLINSASYTDELIRAELTVACLDGEIIGTAGWSPADDNGTTARIRKVFVAPLFTGCGVGKMLVSAVESKAVKAGFKDFSVRANINAQPFFERVGFSVTSYGVMPTKDSVDLPVAFMRKYEPAKRKQDGTNETEIHNTINSVTHESFWHHRTEH